MSDNVNVKQIKRIINTPNGDIGHVTSWDSLMKIAAACWIIAAFGGKYLYTRYHSDKHEQVIAKQEQMSNSLMKNKQLAYRR